jgi:D-arabinonate dehydratase
MKIQEIRTLRLRDPDGPPFQDATMPRRVDGGLALTFVELVSDAGISGIAYSEGSRALSVMIHDQLADLIVGADPFATEKIWNDMFWRVRGNGRKGMAFQAISVLDNAIWDLKAKALNLPLYRLLPWYSSVCSAASPSRWYWRSRICTGWMQPPKPGWQPWSSGLLAGRSCC